MGTNAHLLMRQILSTDLPKEKKRKEKENTGKNDMPKKSSMILRTLENFHSGIIASGLLAS